MDKNHKQRIRRLLRRVTNEFAKPFDNSDWQIQWVRERLAEEAKLLAELLEEVLQSES